MGKIDEVKAGITTVDLVERMAGKRPQGPDGQGRYLALCQFHEDTHESMRIFESGGFRCFTCGAKGGDVIDFYAAVHQVEKPEAIRTLHGMVSTAPAPASSPARANGRAPELRVPPSEVRLAPTLKSDTPARPIARPIENVPAPGARITLHRMGDSPIEERPTRIHVYRDTTGTPIHLVLRMEKAGARKTFRPALWDGERWWAVAQETPRSLYGLETLAGAKQVVLVEGEKAADAARARLPSWLAVVTWPGGASSVGSIDWTPLYGKPVVLWPDNDAPGRKAMLEIAKRIGGHAASVKMVEPGTGLPDKGDAADLPANVDMLAWLRKRVAPWVEPDDVAEEVLDAEVREAEEAARPKPEADTFAGPEEVKAKRNAAFPFHILGQDAEGMAYFLKKADGRMVAATLSSLGRREILCTLAPPSVWQTAFGGMTGTGTDAKPIGWSAIGISAQAHIVEALEHLPTFDPSHTRGRGCWPHPRGIAFNRGDLVEVNGERTADNYVDGMVYERGTPIQVDGSKALTNQEGHRLIGVLEDCSWRTAYAPVALAGWIAVAPICGALPWRPHVWVTGPSGSGKSTVVNEIVLGALGTDLCIRLAGNTSEAGLRQILRRDSLPVIVDEAESDAKSIRGVLDLARSASTGDTVVRGTVGGTAMVFHIRSAFCFASINPSIAKAADESRITQLELRRARGEGADDRYLKMRDDLANLVDPGFGRRLAARMIRLAPTVMESVRVLEDAVTRRFGSRRLAQQWGALLAGAWNLTNENPIGSEEAEQMARYVPLSTVKLQLEEDDAWQMIATLCAYQVSIEGKRGRVSVTVSELIDRLVNPTDHDTAQEIPRTEAEDSLARIGLKVREDMIGRKHVPTVAVARKHAALIGRVFAGTPWTNSYSARLMDIQGAQEGPQLRFSGRRMTSTLVPAEYFLGLPTTTQGTLFDGEQEEEPAEV